MRCAILDGMAPFTEAEIETMLHLHALPDGWPQMPYDEFLGSGVA